MQRPIEMNNLSSKEGSFRWQESLKRAFRSPAELAKYLDLDGPEVHVPVASYGFPFLVTREFASRMKKGDWHDPLLLQVWPSKQESMTVPGFSRDPVGELGARIESGLMQKYHGRVLMVTTGACAIHCRYCFRRHYPYTDEPKSIEQWLPALDRIEADDSISEVILSGGDPLMIVDQLLEKLVERIQAISHVERLRIHTRLPIVLPSRVDDGLIRMLDRTRLATYVIVHCNHRNEIDESVIDAFRRLRSSGAVILNQAVLLRGINDNVTVLEDLCSELSLHGVLPYYLHLLDPVQGASNFDVPIEYGKRLMVELRKRLPGYAMPELVQELAGEASKTPV
jgi:L-lysine 2,3-aminomutase